MNKELIRGFYHSNKPTARITRESKLSWAKNFFRDRSDRVKIFKAYLREPTFQQVFAALEGHANSGVISRELAYRASNELLSEYYKLVRQLDGQTNGRVVKLLEERLLAKSKDLSEARLKKRGIGEVLGAGNPEFAFGVRDPKERKLIEVTFAGGNGRVTVADLK